MRKPILCIMVKNEEARIRVTLDTAAQFIRHLVVYDTGSTDKTLEKIQEFIDETKLPYTLLEGKFVDYSTSRNFMLGEGEKLCEEGEFMMVLDSNDELTVSNPEFLEELEKVPKAVNGVMVNSYWEFSDERNIMSHIKFLMLRAKKAVRYRGRVHEFLMDNGVQFQSYYFLKGILLRQDRSFDDAKTQQRYKSDIENLLLDLEDEKEYVGRIYFYLGKTYLMLRDMPNAIKYLKLRVKYKGLGDDEEAHNAYMYLGMISLGEIAPKARGNSNPVLKLECARHIAKGIKYMLEAYHIVPRIEPVMHITKHYIEQEQWGNAYLYAARMCTLELPSHAHSFNMKVYIHTRWYFKSVICYNLQKYEEGLDAIAQIDVKKLTAQEITEYERVKTFYADLAMQPEVNQVSYRNEPLHTLGGVARPQDLVAASVCGSATNSQQLRHGEESSNSSTAVSAQHSQGAPCAVKQHKVLLACGCYWHKWDGNLAQSANGIGGSELVAIKNAEYLARMGLDVYFCCDCEKEITVNGVHYLPLIKYDSFIKANKIHTLYVYRLASMIRYENVQNVYLSMEDVTFVGNLSINTGIFRKLVCKSEWQRDLHAKQYENIKDMLTVVGNGIEPSRFDVANVPKAPCRFMYSSCPQRGLDHLLRMFPKIREFMPEAELHVFIDTKIVNYRDDTERIMKMCQDMKEMPGVVVHPKVAQDVLAVEMLKTSYWLYPTKFAETYCITAQEMQAAGALCIYYDLAALATTVGDRGIAITADPSDPANDHFYIDAVRQAYEKKIDVEDLIRRGREWALENSWDKMNSSIHSMIVSV